MIRLTLAALLVAGAAYADPSVAQPEDRSWHLLQRQYDGLIRSVQHGFTKHECEFARARIMGEPVTDEEKAAAKKIHDDAAARDKAEQDQWALDHPGCHYGYRMMQDPPGCPDQGITMGTAMTWSNYAVPMTSIASAECFQ